MPVTTFVTSHSIVGSDICSKFTQRLDISRSHRTPSPDANRRESLGTKNTRITETLDLLSISLKLSLQVHQEYHLQLTACFAQTNCRAHRPPSRSHGCGSKYSLLDMDYRVGGWIFLSCDALNLRQALAYTRSLFRIGDAIYLQALLFPKALRIDPTSREHYAISSEISVQEGTNGQPLVVCTSATGLVMTPLHNEPSRQGDNDVTRFFLW